jgi:hypothetical protein
MWLEHLSVTFDVGPEGKRMLLVIAALLVVLIAVIFSFGSRLVRIHHAQIQQTQQLLKQVAEQVEIEKAQQADLKRVAGYVRYIRARAWQDDPTFIEDLNEGASKLSPKWHELMYEYGVWLRDEDEHEGAMRIMRGERTKMDELLREELGDAKYEEIKKMRSDQSMPPSASSDPGV